MGLVTESDLKDKCISNAMKFSKRFTCSLGDLKLLPSHKWYVLRRIPPYITLQSDGSTLGLVPSAGFLSQSQ